jgi:hypothetical protein
MISVISINVSTDQSKSAAGKDAEVGKDEAIELFVSIG